MLKIKIKGDDKLYNIAKEVVLGWHEVHQYLQIQHLKRLKKDAKICEEILADRERVERLVALSKEELLSKIKTPNIDLSRQRAGARIPFRII